VKSLAQLDQQFVWHPFTQMRDWLRREPIVIVRGEGAVLEDAAGRKYLDANSSIWTNLHGHNHPAINSAIESQLRKIAHSSALGLANEPASSLAAELIQVANPSGRARCPQRAVPQTREVLGGSRRAGDSAPCLSFRLWPQKTLPRAFLKLVRLVSASLVSCELDPSREFGKSAQLIVEF